MAVDPASPEAWTMTTTPPEAPAGPPTGGPDDSGPRVSSEEVRDLGRLRRSATDRKVAGVAGGLARHLDVDPLILRVAFVVLAFFGGAGLILYGACWLVVPDESTESAPVTLDDRSRTIALVIVGVLAAAALVGDTSGAFWFPWPLAIIGLIVWLLLTRRDRRTAPPQAGVTSADPPGPAESALPATYSARPPRQPNPRKRGPLLFWFTVALIVFAEGLLGTFDLAGAPVADAAYPALAVGLIGAMLLVGAFYGRAGGLIFLGLVATTALVGATASDRWDGGADVRSPATSAEVEDRYDFGAGELVLDLTEVSDPENLDGRTIHLDGGAARIEVIVPDGLDVTVDATVGGIGSVETFGTEREGIDTSWTERHDDGDVAELTLDIRVGLGEIYVDEE